MTSSSDGLPKKGKKSETVAEKNPFSPAKKEKGETSEMPRTKNNPFSTSSSTGRSRKKIGNALQRGGKKKGDAQTFGLGRRELDALARRRTSRCPSCSGKSGREGAVRNGRTTGEK